MANVLIARGGESDYKGWMCDGQWAEYGPSYNTPQLDYTPPFNSHADGAHGQGYLNLHFPLVPNLNGTSGHHWMQNALKGLSAVNDILFTNWVPTRSYVSSIYFEVSKTDPMLDGVYVKPVAYRVSYDFTTQDWKYAAISDFATEMTNAGITEFPLGTPQEGEEGEPDGEGTPTDALYGIAILNTDSTKKPSTFGHNIVKRDSTGTPIGGVDDYFGTVLLGLQITKGDASKIASIWKSNIAFYLSAKLHTFEGSTQIG